MSLNGWYGHGCSSICPGSQIDDPAMLENSPYSMVGISSPSSAANVSWPRRLKASASTGLILLIATIYLVVNLLVDLVYSVVDPRIRYR